MQKLSQTKQWYFEASFGVVVIIRRVKHLQNLRTLWRFSILPNSILFSVFFQTESFQNYSRSLLKVSLFCLPHLQITNLGLVGWVCFLLSGLGRRSELRMNLYVCWGIWTFVFYLYLYLNLCKQEVVFLHRRISTNAENVSPTYFTSSGFLAVLCQVEEFLYFLSS